STGVRGYERMERMPPRYRRSAHTMGRQRRRHIWATLNTTATVATATGITPLDMLGNLEVAGVGIVGGTVVRSHVMLSFSDPNTDTDPGLFWGAVIYDKAKVAANTPAVLTEVGLNWLMIREITPGCAPTSWQNSGFTDYLF